MADDQQQTEDTQEQTEGDGTATATTGDARGDDGDAGEKPGDKLLGALKAERERANKAERELKRIDGERRKAETERAIKAGEWEAVAKDKDGEIADLTGRIAELEGQIAQRDTDLIRAQVAAEFRFDPYETRKIAGDTIEEMRADAKEMAKRKGPTKPADTEAGRGNGQGGRDITKEHQQAADESRIYTPY